jgi:oxygen-independent coproporphyrinogen-3 oxidase
MSRISPHDPRRLQLLAKYDGYAPRYTSYPSAAQFTPGVDAQTHANWLSAINPDKPVSVYTHIPLCNRLCWYCGCNTRAIHRQSTVTSYVERLIDELVLVEPLLPGRLRASAVHLGGGTPNMLGLDDLTSLFAALRHVFRVAPLADIAAELDPGVLTERWVRAAVFHGLTRASIGVQDLDPQVQQAINRIEPFEVIERAVNWLRSAEVRSVNFDLMYGLPHQTEARLMTTVQRCLTLRPDRIALFGYAHVPWAKAHQKLIPTEALPTPEARIQHSEVAAEAIVAAGYVRVGMDHFALPDDDMAEAVGTGRLHRNFQGYTVDQAATLIGLGASAISRFEQGYAQNNANELAWRTAIGEGRLATSRGLELGADDRLRAEVIERLMCDLMVDVGAVCLKHGAREQALDASLAELCALAGDGVVKVSGRTISLTELGRPFIRIVAAAFDAAQHDARSYSRAV